MRPSSCWPNGLCALPDQAAAAAPARVGSGTVFGLFLKAARPIQDTPETAARILVQLATSPDINSSGGFYDKRASTKASALSQNRETATDLWQATERLLNNQGFTTPAI